MKVLQVNIFGNLSTGRIAVDLHRTLVASGGEGIVAFARNNISEDVPHIRIGKDLNVKVHGVMTRLTDRTGFFSYGATKKFLREVDEYKPDIIHLHNIHGYYMHIGLLFDYLRKTGIPVIWTLHDCWAYTGHCCYYSMADCNKWQIKCEHCPQRGAYPSSWFADSSAWNYKKKKELYTGVNMTLVAVSNWLAAEVKKSFLKEYPLRVIYNGINLDVFKPTKSDFKKKCHLENKKIILGVASTWDVRKGLEDFIKLSDMLDDGYQVVVVGVNDEQLAALPPQLIGIKRTDSVTELAGIYTNADVFFNASVEESFGLPVIEAMACGTPAIVYDSTALPELIEPQCGVVVKPHDLRSVVEQINKIEKTSSSDRCIAVANKYDSNTKFCEYIDLYKEILR